jgi:hypothetical protein
MVSLAVVIAAATAVLAGLTTADPCVEGRLYCAATLLEIGMCRHLNSITIALVPEQHCESITY